ncbi:GNAT family N-acetyltransferase [Actinoalloteichus hymeniacidonis]|nr:GNAT family N-acetyltransferase [Actinoalloteichus hymeniacidonis]MBB5909752.1 ribosomal protein S18 acetylase RimI-like enzyme [Actinoalloteichus hymeniacidonis]
MRPSDVPGLVSASIAAGTLFAEHGIILPPDDPAATLAEAIDVLVAEPIDSASAERQQAAGPVGFAATTVLDGHCHLEELAVHPAYGRLGIGSALLAATTERAARRGFTRVTLTTFADVPFNAPWYRRRGFEPLPERDWGPELIRQRAREVEAGIAVAPRVVLFHDPA